MAQIICCGRAIEWFPDSSSASGALRSSLGSTNCRPEIRVVVPTTLPQVNLLFRLQQSRWRWFWEGLPSLARATALFRVRRYTMTKPQRCKHLWNVCNEVLDQNVMGSFVECGVWRGGSAARIV